MSVEFISFSSKYSDISNILSFSFSPSTDKVSNNNNVHEGALKINSPLPIDQASKENLYAQKDTRKESVAGFLPIEMPTIRENNAPEKRKWSQVNTHKLLQQFASGNDSSSSDDEIKELCSKKSGPLLSSSPPGKVTVLSKHSAFSARVRPTLYTEGHSRKKHRFVFAEPEDEAFFSRPSLNFEKMQQVGLKSCS